MASLRRFDTQARYGLIASFASILPLLCAIFFSFNRYNANLQAIEYGKEGKFKIVFILLILVSVGLSVTGLGLGFNSAGQRRNDEQKKSWMAFFIGAAGLSAAIIILFAFKTLGLERGVG